MTTVRGTPRRAARTAPDGPDDDAGERQVPERNIEPGKHGRRGTHSALLAAAELEARVRYVASPVTSPRGLAARLRYLDSADGREALREAGVTVTDGTLRRWHAGRQKPGAANLARLERAYTALRRRRVAAYLIRELERSGAGTRVELYPADDSAVARQYRRNEVEHVRSVNVRHWLGIVEAWAEQDFEDLVNEWEDAVLGELGSEWGGYEYASGVGF